MAVMAPLLRRSEDGGILQGPLPEDTTRTSLLVCMLSIAMYQCLVVYLKVLNTFKRRDTLYFWSLLIAATGIEVHSVGIILKWWTRVTWPVHTAFASFGWWGMVTGQSLVLYSRLHLVVRNQRLLRAILVMIVFDFVVFQVVTTVLTFGSNQAEPGNWAAVYAVYERIQLIVFTVQESIISVVYIRAALKIVKPIVGREAKKTSQFLIFVAVLCIVLDIAFVIQTYSGEWVYKTGTQSLSYAIKLTLEFIILNRLMSVVGHGNSHDFDHDHDRGSPSLASSNAPRMQYFGDGAGPLAGDHAAAGDMHRMYIHRPSIHRPSAHGASFLSKSGGKPEGQPRGAWC